MTWLDSQEDISGSLRDLIHQAIERDGYTDVLNKSVDQLGKLPRRGRPPGGADEHSRTASSEGRAENTGQMDAQDGEPSREAVGARPAAEPASEPAVEPEPERRQYSIDEIMASTRR